MTTDPQPPAALTPHYEIKDRGWVWVLRCKRCRQAWQLPKENPAPGNLLALLEHAASHKEQDR